MLSLLMDLITIILGRLITWISSPSSPYIDILVCYLAVLRIRLLMPFQQLHLSFPGWCHWLEVIYKAQQSDHLILATSEHPALWNFLLPEVWHKDWFSLPLHFQSPLPPNLYVIQAVFRMSEVQGPLWWVAPGTKSKCLQKFCWVGRAGTKIKMLCKNFVERGGGAEGKIPVTV